MINKLKLDKILKKVDKPARYIGMEVNSIKKDLDKVDVKFAFCFPDVYEVGMSHLGLHIIYNLINSHDNYACERVFTPWVDMEEEMRKDKLPLFTIENKTEVSNFDILGFTLQYEMSYTNILNILNLANIPFKSKDRDESYPLIIAGGPCAYNPEPLADFIDIFVIGEGEEVTIELLNLYNEFKKSGFNKEKFLLEATQIQGTYVPAFYDVDYNQDGTISKFYPIRAGVPSVVSKRFVEDVSNMYTPDKIIVPYIETIHDRIVLEIFRGCTRGCRFCQAGILYRPIREKSVDSLMKIADNLVKSTGYENISLSSLSSCDYTSLQLLTRKLMDQYEERKIGISLPSLRVDSSSLEVLKEIEKVRKTGLTFAPEAGSQRLRDVINKGVTEEDLKNTVTYAFQEGWSKIKLYFMIGLPTETDEDVLGIKNLAYLVRDQFFDIPKEDRKGDFKVTASASCFVPKPFTPFQWVGQDTIEEFRRKTYLVKNSIKDKKVSFNYHDADLSFLEAIFARGDRKLCDTLIKAWEKGCKYDGWSEFFNFEKWIQALEETNIDGYYYANRKRDMDEILPWDFIDLNVSKDYLINEYKKSMEGIITDDCRLNCNACGFDNCSMWGAF